MTPADRPLGILPAEARHLRNIIFAVAKARGVALREVSFRLDHEIPVVRFRTNERNLVGCEIRIPGGSMSAQKVITVSGPSRQWSRSWPRKVDGAFDISAVVDFLVALVQHEQAKPLPPELQVPKGLPAARSGLHVVHLAAVRLGCASREHATGVSRGSHRQRQTPSPDQDSDAEGWPTRGRSPNPR